MEIVVLLVPPNSNLAALAKNLVDVNRFVPKETIASIRHLAAVLKHSSYSVKVVHRPSSLAA